MLSEKPITFPCGVTAPNRLTKVAMAENMGDAENRPSEKLNKVYAEWADGGWGMILPGNVQVTDYHLGQAKDVAAPTLTGLSESQLAVWKSWASTIQRSGALGIIQLAHPGRQSPRGAGRRGLFAKAVAPSAVPLNLGDGWLDWIASFFAFGTPRALTIEEIEGPDGIIERFVNGAKLCHEAGFKGVELHGAHGYLLAQFLSAQTNLRTDAYGGSPEARAYIVTEILRRVRAATSPSFVIGIKLNSVDMSDSAALGSKEIEKSLADALTQIGLIAEAGVDFIEISGGSYENPLMAQNRSPGDGAELSKPGAIKESTWRREVFFLEFADAVRAKYPELILMLTGGFRSRAGIEGALSSRAADLIGLGRPAAVYPKLPNHIVFNTDLADEKASFHVKRGKVPWVMDHIPIKAIGAGRDSFYFGRLIASRADK